MLNLRRCLAIFGEKISRFNLAEIQTLNSEALNQRHCQRQAYPNSISQDLQFKRRVLTVGEHREHHSELAEERLLNPFEGQSSDILLDALLSIV